MKTKPMLLLLILSITLNAYAIIRIAGLNRDMTQLGSVIQSQLYNMDSELNSLTYNFEQKLEEQASLLESYEIKFGVMDSKTLKVPAHVTVTPKRLETGTVAKLIINGQETEMAPGADYTLEGTVAVSIFEVLRPAIVFEHEGTREIQKLMIYQPIRFDYLPNMGASFNGQINKTSGANQWRIRGDVYIALDPNKYKTEIESVKLLAQLDGVTVKTYETELSTDITIPINEEVTLEADQTYTLLAVMKDIYGLTHSYYVDGFLLNPSGEFGEAHGGYGRLVIVDSDGKEIFSEEK